MTTPSSAGVGAATRRALLDAAVDRFGRDGLRATSVASISRQAGLGRTNVFAHFANKHALFVAAVEHDMSALVDEVLAEVEASSPDPDWFRTTMASLAAILPSHALAHRLLAGLEPEVARTMLEGQALDRMRAAVEAQLETSRERGRLRDGVDTSRAADGLLAVLVGFTMTRHQFGEAMDGFLGGIGHILEGLFEPGP